MCSKTVNKSTFYPSNAEDFVRYNPRARFTFRDMCLLTIRGIEKCCQQYLLSFLDGHTLEIYKNTVDLPSYGSCCV